MNVSLTTRVKMEELAIIQKAVSHVPALGATLEMYVIWTLTNV